MILRDRYGFLRDIRHPDGGPWMSHRGILLLALEATKDSPHPILELGMGDGSTPQLHAYASGEGRALVSLENDPVQYARFRHLGVGRHEAMLVDWARADILDKRWSVVLVDHAPPERRRIEIARLRDRAEILVVHDTEPSAEGYGLHRIWPLFRYRVDFNPEGVGTSALSNTVDVERLWTGFHLEGREVRRIVRAGDDVDSERTMFSGSGISAACLAWIREHIPRGSLVLELGSGPVSTQYLSRDYRLVSVEHDPAYLGAYPSEYVHAPLEDGWYAVDPIRWKLAELRERGLRYDLFLVDGPIGSEARAGLLLHLDLFDLSVPVIVDDVEREAEREIVLEIARQTGREPAWKTQFAVV